MPSTPTRRTLLVAAVALVAVCAAAVPLAERRALSAEERHVTVRLDDAPCLDDWGVNEGAGPSRAASVTGVAGGGLRVAVTVPYAYRTTVDGETVYADGASEAVYAVTLAGTRRLRGDEIAPCRSAPGARARRLSSPPASVRT